MALRGLLVLSAMAVASPAFAQTLPPPDVRVTPANAVPQATMTGPAMMTIAGAVRRRIQPCADRQIIPAPEASEIATVVRIHLNRDGSLADLKIMEHQGVTDANRQYVPTVDRAIEVIFRECTPIQGLPPELYDPPRGWRQMTFRYRLRS